MTDYYMLVCKPCGDDTQLPFTSAERRGKWAKEHTKATGHDEWIVFDEIRGEQDKPKPWAANDTDLHSEFSARVWAERFVHRVAENPSIATDEGTMIAWFAGAIMAGYDHAKLENEQPKPTPNDEPCIQDIVTSSLRSQAKTNLVDSRLYIHVADYIERRKQIGIQRYGTVLQPNNGRDALRDAFEEAADLTVYLTQFAYENIETEGLEDLLTDSFTILTAIGYLMIKRDGGLP